MTCKWIAPVFAGAVAGVLMLPQAAGAHTYEIPSSTAVAVSATVRSGDTAWAIAAKLCGSGSRHSSLLIKSPSGSVRTNHNLIYPGDRVSGQCGTTRAAPRVSTSSGGWVAPLSSWSLSSCYGMRFDPYYHRWQLHDGLDMSVPSWTRIHAVHAGVVIRAGWAGGWGNMVEINHGGGVTTLYAHQSRIAATVGQRVAKGQTIGYVGSTGASTGPHLHLRLHLNGKPANPAPYLRARGVPIRGC